MSYAISYDIWMVNGHPDQVGPAAVLFLLFINYHVALIMNDISSLELDNLS